MAESVIACSWISSGVPGRDGIYSIPVITWKPERLAGYEQIFTAHIHPSMGASDAVCECQRRWRRDPHSNPLEWLDQVAISTAS